MLIFSLKFDQSYPFTKMTQKVCHINGKNSDILSKLRNSEPGGVSGHTSAGSSMQVVQIVKSECLPTT